MAVIHPSILSADFGKLGAEVAEVVAAGATGVHVDVMDGRFVPNLTLGPVVVKAVSKAAGDALVDVHLMIVEPDRYLQDFRDAGAGLISVHAEACPHLHRSIQAIRATGAKTGVALNPHTPLNVLDYVLEDLDLVLLMSVNPGFGGQSLISSVFRKISALRDRIESRGLSTWIEVDGGVKPSNAQRLSDAGATHLVAGSAVFGQADRAAAMHALTRP